MVLHAVGESTLLTEADPIRLRNILKQKNNNNLTATYLSNF